MIALLSSEHMVKGSGQCFSNIFIPPRLQFFG